MCGEASYFDLKNPPRAEWLCRVVSSLAHECGLGAVDHVARALILVRLWVQTRCPVQIRAPSVPTMRVRSQP
jgi:hypothetical protein